MNADFQAEFRYDFAGRQAVRMLHGQGVTLHSVFDSQGRRIADCDAATGALQREYVWLGWSPVAVVQGGMVQFVRADHVDRPVFATNAAGDVVWAQSYDPFGRVVSGGGNDARFAGQGFATESGLHQNWLRDFPYPPPAKNPPKSGAGLVISVGCVVPTHLGYSLAETASQFTNLSKKLVK